MGVRIIEVSPEQREVIRRNLELWNSPAKAATVKVASPLKSEPPKIQEAPPRPDYETVIRPAKWAAAIAAAREGKDATGTPIIIEGRRYEITEGMAFAAKKTVEAEKKSATPTPHLIRRPARPDGIPSRTQVRKTNRLKTQAQRTAV